MADLSKIESKKEYYKALREGLTFASMWSNLQRKSDYGSRAAELGYQEIARMMAGEIAEKLGGDPNLAEVLLICQASFYPPFGNVGLSPILQYLSELEMGMTEEQLAVAFIEDESVWNELYLSPEMRNMINDLFDRSREPERLEIRIARLCGEIMEDIKRIRRACEKTPANFL